MARPCRCRRGRRSHVTLVSRVRRVTVARRRTTSTDPGSGRPSRSPSLAGHPIASRGGEQAVVLEPVADGQPEAARERMVGREGPRHEALGEQAFRHLGRASGVRERDEQEVRHARLGPPACVLQRLGEPGPLAFDAGEVGRQHVGVAEGLGDDGDRHRRDGAGRPIRLDPRERRAPGDREADSQAGQGIGLARRAHGHEPRIAARSPTRLRADELAVGLVEDDDRRLPAVGRPRRRSGPPAGLRSGRPARAARSGCSGCTARRRERHGRLPGPPAGRSPGRRPDRSRGTATTSAPRCSVRTRYIA